MGLGGCRAWVPRQPRTLVYIMADAPTGIAPVHPVRKATTKSAKLLSLDNKDKVRV